MLQSLGSKKSGETREQENSIKLVQQDETYGYCGVRHYFSQSYVCVALPSPFPGEYTYPAINISYTHMKLPQTIETSESTVQFACFHG